MKDHRREFQVVDADDCPINDPEPSLTRARVRLRQLVQACPELGPFRIEYRSVTVGEWEPVEDPR